MAAPHVPAPRAWVQMLVQEQGTVRCRQPQPLSTAWALAASCQPLCWVVQGVAHHPDARAQGQPPASPLTQALHNTNGSWKHGVSLGATLGKRGLSDLALRTVA